VDAAAQPGAGGRTSSDVALCGLSQGEIELVESRCAALSDILPADVARQMAATSESARLVEVPDVGHAPMLSEPEARDAILALLERVA